MYQHLVELYNETIEEHAARNLKILLLVDPPTDTFDFTLRIQQKTRPEANFLSI